MRSHSNQCCESNHLIACNRISILNSKNSQKTYWKLFASLAIWLLAKKKFWSLCVGFDDRNYYIVLILLNGFNEKLFSIKNRKLCECTLNAHVYFSSRVNDTLFSISVNVMRKRHKSIPCAHEKHACNLIIEYSVESRNETDFDNFLLRQNVADTWTSTSIWC